MRIVDWNVGYLNPNKMDGIRYVFSLKPDVVTFQELPSILLRQIETEFPEYNHAYADQWKSILNNENDYLAIFSKYPIIKMERFDLYLPDDKRWYKRLVYESIFKMEEKPSCLAVSLKVGKKKVNFYTTQLSASVRPKERLLQLGEVMAKLDRSEVNILCGDLNITDSRLFKYVTGFVRSYAKLDYRVDEKDLAARYFEEMDFKNVFDGEPTCFWRFLKLQFDHVLVPSDIKVIRKYVRGRMGSDHAVLTCDLDL